MQAKTDSNTSVNSVTTGGASGHTVGVEDAFAAFELEATNKARK